MEIDIKGPTHRKFTINSGCYFCCYFYFPESRSTSMAFTPTAQLTKMVVVAIRRSCGTSEAVPLLPSLTQWLLGASWGLALSRWDPAQIQPSRRAEPQQESKGAGGASALSPLAAGKWEAEKKVTRELCSLAISTEVITGPQALRAWKITGQSDLAQVDSAEDRKQATD